MPPRERHLSHAARDPREPRERSNRGRLRTARRLCGPARLWLHPRFSTGTLVGISTSAAPEDHPAARRCANCGESVLEELTFVSSAGTRRATAGCVVYSYRNACSFLPCCIRLHTLHYGMHTRFQKCIRVQHTCIHMHLCMHFQTAYSIRLHTATYDVLHISAYGRACCIQVGGAYNCIRWSAYMCIHVAFFCVNAAVCVSLLNALKFGWMQRVAYGARCIRCAAYGACCIHVHPCCICLPECGCMQCTKK